MAGSTKISAGALLWAAAVLSTSADWVKEIEIQADPEKDGIRVFTVRFTPQRTENYDRIIFECVYHQEFPWVTPRGERYTKIHEPVSFIFRAEKPRFVAELDHYISFRVPSRKDDLILTHGQTVFNKDYPITISKVKISAVLREQTVWSIELPPSGVHSVGDLFARKFPEPKPPPEESSKESDNSGAGKQGG